MIVFDNAFKSNPLIAILRGLEPVNAVEVAGVLVRAGFTIIEVPLNSPDPLVSIKEISDYYGDQIIVGAGTVTNRQQVNDVWNMGGKMIICPNMDLGVGQQCKALGLDWCPGVVSPTEAFLAINEGASLLKFFPAELVSASVISSMLAVLPADTRVVPVGGISVENMADYYRVGVSGFGLGSALFKSSYSISEIEIRAKKLMNTFSQLRHL